MFTSHDGDLHAVDGREGIEQALPPLAAVAANPELSRRSPEIESWRGQLVDVQRVAQNGEVALLLRQSFSELLPGATAVLTTPDARGGARRRACRRLERHDIDCV